MVSPYVYACAGGMHAAPVTSQEVGVICMSRAQAICVRNLLREQGLGDVNVGTVDDFQGQEMRVIFVTSVLSHGVKYCILWSF